MPWYWRLHIGDQCLWKHVFLIGFAFSADAVVALLIVGVSMTQSFKAGKRSSTHEQWQQPRVFFSTAALKDKFSMDAAMADERRVRLCGLPFLMNEAWLRNVLHSQDIRQPWKVVLLRKGEHRSWSQWQNAFLFYWVSDLSRITYPKVVSIMRGLWGKLYHTRLKAHFIITN